MPAPGAINESNSRPADVTCAHCEDAEDFFSEKTARRDLRRFRKKGPIRSTRMLVDAIRTRASRDRTLLDVGGGVGAIQHELLAGGFESAVQVDASHAYLRASEDETDRLGHTGRVTYRFGDFVELDAEILPAHVVTLDRVICCYPEMDRLVDSSARKALHLYGLVYPREKWANRLLVRGSNLYFRIRRVQFRTYIHAESAVRRAVERCGFRIASHATTYLWHVALFERES